MNIPKKPQFVPIEFEFYDCGIVAAVGIKTFSVFSYLRRNVMRKTMQIYEHWTTEHIIASGRYVTQAQIADALGIAESKVYLDLQTLETIRWVQQLSKAGAREPAYSLGRRRQTPNGRWVEMLKATDSVLRVKAAIGGKRVFDTAMEHRVTIAKKVLFENAASMWSESGATPAGSRTVETPPKPATPDLEAATPSAVDELLPVEGAGEAGGSSCSTSKTAEPTDDTVESDDFQTGNREQLPNREPEQNTEGNTEPFGAARFASTGLRTRSARDGSASGLGVEAAGEVATEQDEEQPEFRADVASTVESSAEPLAPRAPIVYLEQVWRYRSGNCDRQS